MKSACCNAAIRKQRKTLLLESPLEEGLMPLLPRQADILALARDAGRLDVEALAERFDVTPQTIRKDLNELCEQGLLQRYHGGAMLPSGVANLAYESRRQLATEAKRRIGQKAAELIPNDCSLLVNIGTTTEQVAMALRGHKGLMVITNNMNAVNILRGYDDIEVIVAGGVLRHSDGGIVGAPAVEFLRQFKVDYAVIGTSAIDEDGSLLDYDYREVEVARKIVETARCVILVADSLKYERSAPVRIGHISEVDHFVTDATPPERLQRICADHDVKVEVATDKAPAALEGAR
jgi:DeoR family glycerol-3-phosphate regulon repressor